MHHLMYACFLFACIHLYIRTYIHTYIHVSVTVYAHAHVVLTKASPLRNAD